MFYIKLSMNFVTPLKSKHTRGNFYGLTICYKHSFMNLCGTGIAQIIQEQIV